MHAGKLDRPSRSSTVPILLLLLSGSVLGIAAAVIPDVAISVSLVSILGLVGSVFLLVAPRSALWKLWLLVIALAAFGPFLDIVTHKPVNWLLGFVALFPFLALAIRSIASPRLATPTGKPALALGTGFFLFNIYFLLHALRPDIGSLNALLAWRAPLIGLAAYFVTVFLVSGTDSDPKMRLFFKILIIVGAIVAIYGLFQFWAGFDRLQAWGLTETGARYLHHQRNLAGGTMIFRIYGTMRRNESLGGFLYLIIVACTVGLRLGLRPRWLIIGSLALSLVALLLTLSLTNLVALAVWICLLVIASRSKRLIRMAAVVGLVGLIAVLLANMALDGLIGVRFAEHALDVQQDRGRVRMFLNWVEEISERPFLQGMTGSGVCSGLDENAFQRIRGVLGALGIQVGELFQCGWQREIRDNWYATLSLEIGWLGLALFWLVFVLMAVFTLPRVRRRWSEPKRGAWTILTLGILALWPSGFVGALFMYMPITLYFWSLVGLLDVVAIGPNQEQEFDSGAVLYGSTIDRDSVS